MYINLGILLRDKNCPDESAKWLTRGVTLLKNQPYKDKSIASALANLGYAYLDLEKYSEMKNCFEEALKYDEKFFRCRRFLYILKIICS